MLHSSTPNIKLYSFGKNINLFIIIVFYIILAIKTNDNKSVNKKFINNHQYKQKFSPVNKKNITFQIISDI